MHEPTDVIATGLSKTYRGRYVLRDFNLEISEGIALILGANGSGKTTAILQMLGVVRGQGTCTFGGVAYGDLASPAQTVGASLGYDQFHPSRTVRAQVELAARPYRLGARQIDRVIDDVGLTAARGVLVKECSRGMKQRLSVACGLVGDPKVLILDEPLDGLDASGQKWLLELLDGWRQRGRTAILATHQFPDPPVVADRVIVLQRGMTIYEGNLDWIDDLTERFRPPILVDAKLETGIEFPFGEDVKPIANGRYEVRGHRLDEVSAGLVAIGAQVSELRYIDHLPYLLRCIEEAGSP